MKHQHIFPTVLALAATLVVTGCASTTGVSANDDAPTPYTAEAIRLSNPPGTTIVFRVEQPGQPAVRQTIRFISGDADGCELEQSARADDGTVIQPAARSTSGWEELRDHARFPAATTERARDRCTVTIGSFDCWRYDVTDEELGTVTRFYFARDRAGPPVLMETRAGDEVVFRMEMIEDTRGG